MQWNFSGDRNPLYFIAKCFVLVVYYAVLHHLGLGLEFKFWSCQLLTPIAKYFHFNRLKLGADRWKYAFSIFGDFSMTTFMYKYIYPTLVESKYVCFPFVICIAMVILEYAQHVFLRDGSKYKIKLSTNPLDFSQVFVLSATFVAMGKVLDFDQAPSSPFTFVCLFVPLLVFDIGFGFIHYYLHKVPWLWEKHKVHHQYSQKDLNCFANFYGEALDGLSMNTSFFFASIACMICHMHPVIMMEVLFPALLSHHKYNANQLHLMYFFEYDAIDMIFGKKRLCSCHHAHHNAAGGHLSAFGFIQDRVFNKLCGAL